MTTRPVWPAAVRGEYYQAVAAIDAILALCSQQPPAADGAALTTLLREVTIQCELVRGALLRARTHRAISVWLPHRAASARQRWASDDAQQLASFVAAARTHLRRGTPTQAAQDMREVYLVAARMARQLAEVGPAPTES